MLVAKFLCFIKFYIQSRNFINYYPTLLQIHLHFKLFFKCDFPTFFSQGTFSQHMNGFIMASLCIFYCLCFPFPTPLFKSCPGPPVPPSLFLRVPSLAFMSPTFTVCCLFPSLSCPSHGLFPSLMSCLQCLSYGRQCFFSCSDHLYKHFPRRPGDGGGNLTVQSH